ncbi:MULTISPECIES: hypothetical protein [unclassified Brachybacterium]|uniref:hypothetical protein n=1 Tax=unclassified Brachybacterium TaxID=2623841 RepID=UPI003F90D292
MPRARDLSQCAGGGLGAVGIVGVALFLADIPRSQPFFVTLFLVGAPLLLLVRLATRCDVNLARTRARGRLRSQVMVVGSTGHVRGWCMPITEKPAG